MKYFTDFLDSIKRRDFAPVYLFHGPEEYLRRLAVEKLREVLLDAENQEFNLTRLDGEKAALKEIISAAETAPFFSRRRLLIIDRPTFFRTREGAAGQEEEGSDIKGKKSGGKTSGEEETLINYIASPMPSTCVIFNTPNQVDKRKRIFKTVEKHGKVVEFAPLKPADIRKWLDKQARLVGKNLEPAAADTLLARVGQNLTALHTEINKLIDHAGQSAVIKLEDVKLLTAVPLEENIFNVVDAMGEKNAVKAVSGIQNLLLTRQPPQYILSMVARQFRMLLQVKEALSRGCSFGDLTAATGIHPFVVKKLHQQCKGFDINLLTRALNSLHEIDEGVKTGRKDFAAAMELFIIETCQNSSARLN